MSFVHLHLHSEFSLLDGAIRIPALLERVRSAGMPAVAVTDHGNLHGAMEFYKTACAAGIQPIIGIEAYLTEGDRREKSHRFPTHHITLLVKNQVGLKNLFRLVTLANLEGYYYKPRLDRVILRLHHEGLIALSGCLNGVPATHLSENRDELAVQAIREYQSIFGEENYYLEIMDHGLPEQAKVNAGLVELAARLSVPLVATNDCHYLHQEDARAHDILLCIGTGKNVQDKDRLKFSGDQFHVKTPEEMRKVFSDFPEAISNTLEIAKKCEFHLSLGKYHMPKVDVPVGETLDSHLCRIAEEGLNQRLPVILKGYQKDSRTPEQITEVYRARLSQELETIRNTGFSGYFLIVADFINYAKDRGIPVGPGRGSAAGSLVAYATRITDIDPLRYNLLFERFLNPERVTMPDIDVDFCQDGRDEIIAYVSKRYGLAAAPEETRVAQITTFGKMQARAVIRDVGRTMNVPYGEVDRIAKLVPLTLNISLEEAFAQEPRFEEMRKKDPRVDDLLSIAVSLEGLTRHASVHAAGVVISDDRPLTDYLPLYRGQHDEIVTEWDMHGVEETGLIKFDFLGLKTLTLLARAIRLIEQTQGIQIDLLNLEMTDPRVFELLADGDTRGVFQLESSGMRDLMTRLKPTMFEEIIALVALYRPGPLGSGMVDDFILRKHGKIPIQYDLPELESVLKETYGVILYQEQVMQIAALLADYSLGEADLLRRAMGKKIPSEMARQEERFLAGCRRKKIPEAKAKKIFDLMAKFAGYGFNKSHSAAYALLSYQTAYLKAHYPVEFMAACLSIDRSNIDRIVVLLADLRSRNIEVLPPDVNECDVDFTVVNEKIRFGLAAVKNVGEAAIAAIIETRNAEGRFQSLSDFCERVDLRKVNRRVIESLIKCGAFDFAGSHRAELIALLEHTMERAQRAHQDRQVGQSSLFVLAVAPTAPTSPTAQVSEWEESVRLKAEKESVGFFLSGHPLLKFTDHLRKYANSDTDRLSELKDGSTVRLGGLIAAVKEITTKRGDRMAFATLEDLTGTVELVVFADVYRQRIDLFKSEDPIFVVGKLDVTEEQVKILVSDVSPLTDAAALFSGTVHIHLNAADIDEVRLAELRKVLTGYKGDCPAVLHLLLPGRSETILSLPRTYALAPSESLITELRSVLGDTTEVVFL